MARGVISNKLPRIIRETPGVLRLLSTETLVGLVNEQHINKIQIAAAVVVTALVIPLLTKYAALRKQKNGTS